VHDTNDYELVKAAGFNLVTGPPDRQRLAAADAAGLRVLIMPGVTAAKPFDERRADRVVRELDRLPGVWGWYLCDEPDMGRVEPAAVAALCKRWKLAGARKPVAITVFHGAAAAEYGEHADVVLVDRYPVPWQPLAAFGQQVQLARLAIGPRKKLMGLIQAFDWSYHTDAISAPGPFRPPTYAELRCMTYCALVHGAEGLFYYTFDDGRWKMSEQWTTWRDLHAVVSEVNARQPLFSAERRWWPKQHRYANPSDSYNEALDSSIISALFIVRTDHNQCPKGEYLVAVNTTNRRIDYRITLPWAGAAQSPVLGEGRVVALSDGWLTDVFEPYAVHVYGPAGEEK